MARLLLCLSLLLISPLGAWQPRSGAECEAACPDDDGHGPCAADCTGCACRTLGGPMALPLASSAGLSWVLGPDSLEHEDTAPPEGVTGDILHVPIASPA